MTIYDIKEAVKETNPCFFSTQGMKFFGQTLKSFRVSKCEDGRFLITAPRIDRDGNKQGHTQRFFNPINNKLELN